VSTVEPHSSDFGPMNMARLADARAESRTCVGTSVPAGGTMTMIRRPVRLW